MVTLIKYGALSGGEKYNVNQMYIDGLSTDTKPTTTIDGMSIPNGSVFTEVDTGKEYMFDVTSTTWYEQPSGGGGGGGGGGTSNYNNLSNRPSINSTTLAGNKTSSDLGLQSEIDSSHKLSADLIDDTSATNKFNVQADWNQTTDTASDYIKNKPNIPAAQVNSDWNAASGVSQILNKPTLGTAAAAATTDFATAAQGTKADSSIQSVKVNGSALTPDANKAVDITAIPASIVSAGALASGMTATTQSTSDDSTKLATTAFVHDVVDALPEPMVFTGSITLTANSIDTTKASITVSAPSSASSIVKGYTYKITSIASSPVYTGTLKVGDTLIAAKNSPDVTATWVADTDWTIVPSGDETGYVVGKSSGTTQNNLVKWGVDGYTVDDSGIAVETSFSGTSDAKVPTSKSIKTNVADNAVLTGFTPVVTPSAIQNVASTDTITDAMEKLDNNTRLNQSNISSVQGEAQTNNITLTDMNGFATGTVKTGYVDNVANITGYVTIRTYAEPNSRKMQVLEAQDGTTRTRYFNGTTWTDFENSLSAKVDGMSDVISSILVHGTQSWDTIQTIVRSGLAPQYYPVGTLLYDNMDESTGKAFRVVGYDNFFDETLTGQGYSHSMTLLEEKLNYPSIQFDAPEAWLYLSYDGQPIVSGQAYRFTIPNWDASYGGNKTYIFTATANVSKETAADAGDGGQLTLAWAYQQNPTSVSAYANNSSTTALFTANIAVWNGTDECINLGTIKLAMSDADSTYGKLNHIHRARYGSNNYYQSGMRQWLNATTASDWWQPTTIFDRAYGSRSTAGRLSTLNANMVAKIATPTITCITNNLFETGFALNTQYTVKDKIFLLTHTEVGLSDNPNIGSTLAYYVGAANSKRIKYKTDNTAQHWWLRTPYPSVAYSERYVYTSGALSGNFATSISGAAAACIIQ